MDIELEKTINETIEYLKSISIESVEYQLMDPIAKMMLVALIHESQKIKDYVDCVSDKIIEKYCEDFIPRRNTEAIPAISVIEARFKPKKDTELVTVNSGVNFLYKISDNKRQLNYLPIFRHSLLPHQSICVLNHKLLRIGDESYSVLMDKPNCLWIGIETKAEINTLKGLSLLIQGTDGVSPTHIYVGSDNYELDFTDMSRLENIEMLEPFDAQQSSNQFFLIIEDWKEKMLNMDNSSLIFITDTFVDRDVFKTYTYPRIFQQWLESETLDYFKNNTIWLQIVFPENYIVPDNCKIILNAIPVVNVDVNSVTLTQTSPIAKLQKQDDAFFLQIVETSTSANRQGFNMSEDEILIRDFDASCYHNGNLFRDVRNLYNRFIDDYYAFIEYNGIKDGETIKQLREIINKIGKSVGTQNSKYNFDSGTYAMKNMSQHSSSSTTKVTYLSTSGKIGNTPKNDDKMENKKLPSIEKELSVLVSGMGGCDKASVDERYEHLRYYSLTNDRLYTKKDIEAFLRKEIIAEFGKEEFKRIYIKMSIEGAAGDTSLQRGLYITIEFKDGKNYNRAIDDYFQQRIHQKILNKSCIAMPIIIHLVNLEK